MDNQRDCKHGQLARACDRCADEDEIAELRAEVAVRREAVAAERKHCIDICIAQRLTYEIGTNAELAYGEGVEGCIAALGGAALIPRALGA